MNINSALRLAAERAESADAAGAQAHGREIFLSVLQSLGRLYNQNHPGGKLASIEVFRGRIDYGLRTGHMTTTREREPIWRVEVE